MTTKKFEILVLNQISQIGLKRLPAEAYRIAKDASRPDAILVRSQDMHSMEIAFRRTPTTHNSGAMLTARPGGAWG